MAPGKRDRIRRPRWRRKGGGRALAERAALLRHRRLEEAFEVCMRIATALAGVREDPLSGADLRSLDHSYAISEGVTPQGVRAEQGPVPVPKRAKSPACVRVKRCRQRRVERGRCRDCEAPKAPRSKSRCWDCLERQRISMRRRRGIRTVTPAAQGRPMLGVYSDRHDAYLKEQRRGELCARRKAERTGSAVRSSTACSA
jgi:hypothetical protein